MAIVDDHEMKLRAALGDDLTILVNLAHQCMDQGKFGIVEVRTMLKKIKTIYNALKAFAAVKYQIRSL